MIIFSIMVMVVVDLLVIDVANKVCRYGTVASIPKQYLSKMVKNFKFQLMKFQF